MIEPHGRGEVFRSPALLSDLDNDISEATDVSAQNPQIVKRLLAFAERAREDIGDVDHPGRNQRPAGEVSNPMTLVIEKREMRSSNLIVRTIFSLFLFNLCYNRVHSLISHREIPG